MTITPAELRAMFDGMQRQWALTVIELQLAELRRRYRAEMFDEMEGG